MEGTCRERERERKNYASHCTDAAASSNCSKKEYTPHLRPLYRNRACAECKHRRARAGVLPLLEMAVPGRGGNAPGTTGRDSTPWLTRSTNRRPTWYARWISIKVRNGRMSRAWCSWSMYCMQRSNSTVLLKSCRRGYRCDGERITTVVYRYSRRYSTGKCRGTLFVGAWSSQACVSAHRVQISGRGFAAGSRSLKVMSW